MLESCAVNEPDVVRMRSMNNDEQEPMEVMLRMRSAPVRAGGRDCMHAVLMLIWKVILFEPLKEVRATAACLGMAGTRVACIFLLLSLTGG